MTRYLIVLLTLLLLSLSGCNQSGDAPAETEEAIESPMAEPQAPVDSVMEEQAQAAEEAAEEVLLEMPGTIPELVLCTDPRPEMCAQNYAPVCGQHEDGTRLTYSNSCMACTNAEVVGALPGPCPE